MPDADLEIRGGGGRGEGGLQKKFFRLFGPQFGLKIRRMARAPRASRLDRPLQLANN